MKCIEMRVKYESIIELQIVTSIKYEIIKCF